MRMTKFSLVSNKLSDCLLICSNLCDWEVRMEIIIMHFSRSQITISFLSNGLHFVTYLVKFQLNKVYCMLFSVLLLGNFLVKKHYCLEITYYLSKTKVYSLRFESEDISFSKLFSQRIALLRPLYLQQTNPFTVIINGELKKILAF